MKRFLIIALLCITISQLHSEGKKVKLELNEVKVYLSGAELTHTAKLNLKPGLNEFLLENITNTITPNSINAFVSGDASIISLNETNDYLNQNEKSSEVGFQSSNPPV